MHRFTESKFTREEIIETLNKYFDGEREPDLDFDIQIRKVCDYLCNHVAVIQELIQVFEVHKDALINNILFPTVCCSSNVNEHILKVLFENGANPNCRYENGYDPFLYFCSNSRCKINKNMLNLFLQAGANLNALYDYKTTYSMVLIQNPSLNTDILECLHENNVNFEALFFYYHDLVESNNKNDIETKPEILNFLLHKIKPTERDTEKDLAEYQRKISDLFITLCSLDHVNLEISKSFFLNDMDPNFLYSYYSTSPFQALCQSTHTMVNAGMLYLFLQHDADVDELNVDDIDKESFTEAAYDLLIAFKENKNHRKEMLTLIEDKLKSPLSYSSEERMFTLLSSLRVKFLEQNQLFFKPPKPLKMNIYQELAHIENESTVIEEVIKSLSLKPGSKRFKSCSIL